MIIIILIIIIIIIMMITKDYNNPKTITMISELNIGQWVRTPPPPPTQYYLVYAYACSLPLKAPPYLRTDKISEPPLSRAFRRLFLPWRPPLNPKHCSMY